MPSGLVACLRLPTPDFRPLVARIFPAGATQNFARTCIPASAAGSRIACVCPSGRASHNTDRLYLPVLAVGCMPSCLNLPVSHCAYTSPFIRWRTLRRPHMCSCLSCGVSHCPCMSFRSSLQNIARVSSTALNAPSSVVRMCPRVFAVACMSSCLSYSVKIRPYMSSSSADVPYVARTFSHLSRPF